MLFCFCVFQSFEHFDFLAWGRERANRIALVWFCLFPLLLGVWEGLRLVLVALPGLFFYLFSKARYKTTTAVLSLQIFLGSWSCEGREIFPPQDLTKSPHSNIIHTKQCFPSKSDGTWIGGLNFCMFVMGVPVSWTRKWLNVCSQMPAQKPLVIIWCRLTLF